MHGSMLDGVGEAEQMARDNGCEVDDGVDEDTARSETQPGYHY